MWVRAALAIAVAKVVFGCAAVLRDPGFLMGEWAPAPPAWTNLLQVLAYAGAAALLIAGGRADVRAGHLAGVWLLIAAAFSNRLLVEGWQGSTMPPAALLRALPRIPVEALIPFMLWRFGLEFPRADLFGRARGFARFGLGLSLAFGGVLVLLNAGLLLARGSVPATLGPGSPASWGGVFVLAIAALVFVAWKSTRAPVVERRRVRLFLFGLFVGFAPISLDGLLQTAVPAYAGWLRSPQALPAVGSVVLPFLISVPLVTTYAVLVDHAIDLRLVARRALRYALARYTILSALSIPLVVLALLLIVQRHRSVAEILFGRGGIPLLLTGAAAVLTLGFRGPALEALDRRFFREQYDARRILSGLVGRLGHVETPVRLAALIRDEADRALHAEPVVAFLLDRRGIALRDPHDGYRRLAAASKLASLARSRAAPFAVDLERPHSAVAALPAVERRWIADGGFHLLVPLVAPTGSLVGLLALGDKRSELPYTADDRRLLADVAAAGALVFENRILRAGTAEAAPSRVRKTLLECARCGGLADPPAAACPACGEGVVPMGLPRTIYGKFRLERRIGSGGMGVVYRAVDLQLERPVAIKTLPRVSPERALRLRREARTMAAIRHPHLALIYAVESWNGVPLLVLELLDGGTLAERLRRGSLAVDEAVRLALSLGGALASVHRAGLLHRDVKPSNIAFDSDGTAKLLDFGLAQLFRQPDAPPVDGDGIERLCGPGISRTATLTLSARESLAGTPLYLSPEALTGHRAGPGFDLWALATVLYECLAGRHPLVTRRATFSIETLLRSSIPDVREFRPDTPAPLAAFLRQALSRRQAERPASAPEFERRLRKVRCKETAEEAEPIPA